MFVVIDVCVKVRVCGWGEFVAWDRGLGRRSVCWGGEGRYSWLWNFRAIDQEGGRQAPSGNTAMPLVPMVCDCDV